MSGRQQFQLQVPNKFVGIDFSVQAQIIISFSVVCYPSSAQAPILFSPLRSFHCPLVVFFVAMPVGNVYGLCSKKRCGLFANIIHALNDQGSHRYWSTVAS